MRCVGCGRRIYGKPAGFTGGQFPWGPKCWAASGLKDRKQRAAAAKEAKRARRAATAAGQLDWIDDNEAGQAPAESEA